MANRLNPDDGKGQANWADIDEDEDDWAPDTISWKDGTKVTIPQVEEHPIPEDPEPPQQFPQAEGPPQPKSPAFGSSAPARPGTLGSGKNLVLKGAPEKPTLVAKPPAPPTPVKSPWATLPKVDRASPVPMEPPVPQAGFNRLIPNHAPGQKAMPPPPFPPAAPKEIAPDDFNRSAWRDGQASGNRELYNSQNGRYEPVMDRRASMRSDQQHPRQLALLQRSSQPDNSQGPAEPSPAFQTSRVSEPHVPYGRRRGSSNVSGGSGSLHRLKGHDQQGLPPPELLSARRESFTGGSDHSPISPSHFSPSSHPAALRPLNNTNSNNISINNSNNNNQAWPSHISPATTHATPYQPAPPVPPPDAKTSPSITDQDISEQKRLMHERRELAMKRRLEEEAKEEAARRERIRLKLEAMGPAPESRSARMAASKEEVSGAQRPSSRAEQLGGTAVEGRGSEAPNSAAGAEDGSEAGPNSTSAQSQAHPSSAKEAENRGGQQRGGAAPDLPWSGSSSHSDRYPQWGLHGPNKNVWGSPNNDRSLGNGTFNADLSRVSDNPPPPPPPGSLPAKTGPAPGPIAPPTSNKGGTSKPPTGARQPPIGPPRQPQRQDADPKQRTLMHSAWAANVRENDAVADREHRVQQDEDIRKLESQGRTLVDAQAPIRETWRPTKLADDGRRVTDGPSQSFHHGWAEGAPAPGAQKSLSAPGRPAELGQRSHADGGPPSNPILGANTGATTPQHRGSRFFPSRDATRQETSASTDSQRHAAPSPPPPDMAGHPAFDGDVARPHVSLPRPQPVVRLPPSASEAAGAASHAQSKQTPASAWAAAASQRDHDPGLSPVSPGGFGPRRGSMHNTDNKWQARIDSLLGGRKAPPPAKSLAVDSATRSSFEHQRHQNVATISLPSPVPSVLVQDESGSVVSRLMAEECFEEQEMGSLPAIRIPNKVPETAWQPSPAPKPFPKKLLATIVSAEPLTFPHDMSGGGMVFRVFVPGMSETKNITIPFSRTRSNPRRPTRGGRHSSQPHRPGKGRDHPSSSSYSNEHGSSSSGRAPSRNGRGGGSSFRGRDNWSRNSSTPIQT